MWLSFEKFEIYHFCKLLQLIIDKFKKFCCQQLNSSNINQLVCWGNSKFINSFFFAKVFEVCCCMFFQTQKQIQNYPPKNTCKCKTSHLYVVDAFTLEAKILQKKQQIQLLVRFDTTKFNFV
eukprot:TRINITY_DN34868_c0_g2_i2.p1 TRINITY_DN34868_c0_g2~~TRINITY_DN34868_c0_g2_i2.p1  ORF type:complete len:122 (-),score=1.34 TRINITY_DN34868_c0_g2_i2:30-395(-)